MRKIILFDFDGVIADSFEHAFQTNQSFFPKMTRQEYRNQFLGNLYDSLKKTISGFSQQSIDLFWDRYWEGLHRILLFSGIDEAVRELAKHYTLVIVSSGRRDVLEDILKREGILSCFDQILGSEVHLSKVEKFKKAFQLYDVQAADCLFLTDTLGDLAEAHSVGLECIAVGWGYHDLQTLKKGNPKIVIHAPEEILGAVKTHFS